MLLFFIIFYLVILFFVIRHLAYNNVLQFVITFGLLFSFSPLMQYVVFPEYKTFIGYRNISFARVAFEYINFLILLAANLIFYNKIKLTRPTKIILFLWFFLNIFSFISSIDIGRSFNAFLISVVNPVLFGLMFLNKKIIKAGSRYLLFFFLILILFNLSVKYGSVIYNLGRGSVDMLKFGYGVSELGPFRGNSATNFLSFFLPFLFLKNNPFKTKNTKFLFNLTKLIVILCFLFTGSRTAYLILFLTIIYSIYIGEVRIKSFLAISSIFICFYLIFNYVNKFDFFDFIEQRYTTHGTTAVESAQNDERLLLWENSIVMSNYKPFFGYGISNYFLLFNRFSNAHNLFINIFLERGFLVLINLLFMIILILNKFRKQIVKYRNHIQLLKLLRFGFVMFLISSLTGEDFFSIGQVVHSFQSYIFMIFLISPFYFFDYHK